MSGNQPRDMTRHKHVWASPAHEEAEAGRLDVCLLAGGEAVVWDVDPDQVLRGSWTWEQASEWARTLATSRARLSGERWVRVMCDYCAEPLWHHGGGMADVADLPVPAGLAKRLRDWAASFEANDGFDGRHDPAALAAFAAEGNDIARALKAALPDWTIVHHDLARRLAGRDAPRGTWEFEVA